LLTDRKSYDEARCAGYYLPLLQVNPQCRNKRLAPPCWSATVSGKRCTRRRRARSYRGI